MVENFNKISKTLFVPMYGRIYTTEHFPNILNDETAIKLKNKIPPEEKPQSQYTYIASAVRSRNIDKYIDNFLKINPEGIIVEIGCGLETTYFRHPNIKNVFYDLDLPEVIDYREKLIPLIPRLFNASKTNSALSNLSIFLIALTTFFSFKIMKNSTSNN